jgi:hypothetical protein
VDHYPHGIGDIEPCLDRRIAADRARHEEEGVSVWHH